MNLTMSKPICTECKVVPAGLSGICRYCTPRTMLYSCSVCGGKTKNAHGFCSVHVRNVAVREIKPANTAENMVRHVVELLRTSNNPLDAEENEAKRRIKNALQEAFQLDSSASSVIDWEIDSIADND